MHSLPPTAQLSFLLLCLPFLACAGAGLDVPRPLGLPAEDMPLDLERFMGDWYVVAHIPTAKERRAHNALEQYTLRDDGRIDIRFSFCEGALDGPRQTMQMLGWVHDRTTNAEWRVRPFWPLRLAYQVLELDPEYSLTVIGHPSLRYAWVMARAPEIDRETLDAITARLAERGFETERLRGVPHSDAGCSA